MAPTPGAVGPQAQIRIGGDQVRHDGIGLQRVDQLARPIRIGRGAALGRQQIRRKGHVAGQRHAARHILDMWVQTAILVDDDHRRQRAGGPGRAGEIGGQLAAGGRKLDQLGGDAGIVGCHEHGLGRRDAGEARGQAEQSGQGQPPVDLMPVAHLARPPAIGIQGGSAAIAPEGACRGSTGVEQGRQLSRHR